ncbi:AMP-binding protein [Cryomorphaceae bacterium 1068]|nr:AMP-binding protein [Cryomorphaceae bacterium 1068]
MEASTKPLTPFSKYQGVRLNGRFIESNELNQIEGQDQFEMEIISYCIDLFDESETIFIQTSGSTGNPKSLEFPKSALIQSASVTNEYFGLNPKSKSLLSLPLNYVAAKLMVVRAIIGGYNLSTVAPKANPLKDLNELISFVPMTPHQVKSILGESPEAFDKVETVLLGGGEVLSELRAQLLQLNPHFYVGFGMAETLTHFALSKINSEDTTIYKVLPDARISTDERGCLIINRSGITKNDLVTNDLIELTEEGFKWLGRIDNLINSGGVKVIPEEVEKLLSPKIDSRFFVSGIPNSLLGQKVALFIEGKKEIKLDDIAFSSVYQKPKEIIHLEKFLYTESGKVRRAETVKSWLESNGD